MIQFNLLPDVKLHYIRTRRTKRVVILSSLVMIGLSVGIILLCVSYLTVQNQHVANLDKDIDSLRSKLEDTPDLTRILSIQNQLNALPALYDGRPAVDRLPLFVDQTTPVGVSLASLDIDFSTSEIEIRGIASELKLVNSYVDTLKYTMFSEKSDGGESANAFSSVVLQDFSRDDTQATFTVSFTFEAAIFDITKDIELKVPNLVTTRSQQAGGDLFEQPLESEVQ